MDPKTPKEPRIAAVIQARVVLRSDQAGIFEVPTVTDVERTIRAALDKAYGHLFGITVAGIRTDR